MTAPRRWVVAVSVYSAAAIGFTWPLARHPMSLVGAPVGPGDPFLYLWTLGWGMQTWLSHPADIFTGRVFDANIFHPATATLTYSDHLLLQSALLSPIYALTHDVVLCYNVLLLVSLVASALAMHLLVRRTFATDGGAYVAGFAWGFGSFHFAHLLHIQLQALYFLPLTFLFLLRLERERMGDVIALGVLTGLQAIASVYYAVIGGLALVIGAVAMLAAAAPGTWRRGLARLAVAAVIAGVLVLPIGVIYWRAQQAQGFGRNLYEASRGAAFADSYLQVPDGNILYGRTGLLRLTPRASADGVPHTGPERELFPGIALVLLAATGIWFGRRGPLRWFVLAMCAAGALGFVLSLGPDGVRPLYATLHRYVFGFQAVRASSRFSVLVMFALATLGALGWRELAARSRARGMRWAAPIALAAVVIELAYVPVRLDAAPPLRTDVGEWLAAAPGAGAVIVLPLGIDAGNTPAMVQSLEHRRPLVNGYSGQRPYFFAKLVETMKSFPGPEALVALHDTGTRFIVTRQPIADAPADVRAALVERARFADGTIYELTWTPEIDARLSRLTTVVPPPPGPIPFAVGEVARYSVAWDGAGVNLSAGEIALEVQAPRYRLVATAKTAPWMSRFYEANDRFETTTDETLLPRMEQRDQHEGSRHVERAFVFDAARRRLLSGRTVDEARGPNAVALPLADGSRDAIAALFYVRTLPLRPGAVVQFPVNDAGRNLIVEVRVGGEEELVVGGQKTRAIRLDPQLRRGVESRRPVTGTVWLSADPRRLPLRVELSAPFGRITLELVSYKSGT